MSLADFVPLGAASHGLPLNFDGLRIKVLSDSPAVLEGLSTYFDQINQQGAPEELTIYLLNTTAFVDGLDFHAWPRDPGKKGGKDSYCDLSPSVRVLRKVKTGMVFYQSMSELAAVGDLQTNFSQVVNFILSQVMTRLQWGGGLICHAAAMTCSGKSLMLAGFSGRGKSTLMLRLLEREGLQFTSNDRAFLRGPAGQVHIHGIPKMPRINPGTVVGNPRLHSLLPPHELKTYQDMAPHALWELEQKLDVPVGQVFGRNKVAWQGLLQGVVILNWSPFKPDHAFAINKVDLQHRQDLLPAIQKSPGPFFQKQEGSFLTEPTIPPAQSYLAMLEGIPVFELTGAVDFDAASRALAAEMDW